MKMPTRMLALCLILLSSLGARADVLVLIHGYMGSAASWEASGVSSALAANGWAPAGVQAGPRFLPGPGVEAGDKFYTVELPSLAPLTIQADQLQAELQQIAARHPGEPLILAAHSAGGVVARIVLVRGGVPNARALVTIASPHLGTIRALEALDATDDSGPIGWFKDFFGGGLYHAVKASWGALLDLTPAAPGNLLFWLNQQPHPDIRYVSILRTGPVGLGDELVAVFSQDMNNVPVLRGRSERITSYAGHALLPQDGEMLARLLAEQAEAK